MPNISGIWTFHPSQCLTGPMDYALTIIKALTYLRSKIANNILTFNIMSLFGDAQLI
jgi:hypothetical protein